MKIRCEAIMEFTLSKFNELKEIKRKSLNEDGRLYIGDTFLCTRKMAEYLSGKNKNGNIVVRIIEVIPSKEKHNE